MAIIAPYLAKLYSYFSTIDNYYLNLGSWSQSPLLPVLHLVLVAIVFFLVLYLFTISRRKQPIPEQTFPKISASPHLPSTVERWMQDLNMCMATQKRAVGALVYGLREGSSMPLIQEVKCVENVGSSLYSLVLTKVDGVVGLVIKPEEKKPVFQIKMKSLSKDVPATLKPEVVAQSLQEAVLETALYVNFNIINPKSTDEIQSDSEKSCGETEENEVDPARPKGTARSEVASGETNNALLRHRFPKDHAVHSSSAPSTPVGTPLNKQSKLADISTGLGGSFTSLNSITRTSSGRGPAKPIRYREKSLIVNEILFKPEKNGDYYPLVCSLELNHPPQKKSTYLHNDSVQPKLTFDLSSRSSGLKVDLQSSPSSKESLRMFGEFSIEGNNFEKKSTFEVAMGNTDNSAVLQFEVEMKENQEQIQFSSFHKKSNSTSAMSRLNHNNSVRVERSKSSIEKLDSLGETRVTTVTTLTNRSAAGSPAKEVTESESAANQGVSFDPSSVAEAALKDLSRKTSPVHKAKISITAVHKSPPDNPSSSDVIYESSAEETQSQSGSLVSAPAGTPTLTVTPETPPAIHKTATLPEMQSGSGKVRRTRSLMFRNPRKSKDKRPASTMFDAEVVPASSMTSPGSTTSLHRKSRGLSKLFGKKKKKLEALEDEDVLGGNSLSGGEGQVAPSSENSAKVKRSRSFKKLIKGKKKTDGT